MCSDQFEQRNMYLDQILGERRSHRTFTAEYPSEDEIRRILHAGLLAPFAAAAVGTSHDYFRRFFVVGRESKAMSTIAPLVLAQVQRMGDGLEKEMAKNPSSGRRLPRLHSGWQCSGRPVLYLGSEPHHGILLWPSDGVFPR